ncbi:MAG: hypothetical protein Q8936_06025 [Bacillota bacterium]|nr:hypothetical protein [Bacillota bacterium]
MNTSKFVNLIISAVGLILLGYMVYGFVYGSRKLVIILLCFSIILSSVYRIYRCVSIIKKSNDSGKTYRAKIELAVLLTNSAFFLIIIPIIIKYLT